MKKSALPAALLLIGALLPGCPVYDVSDAECDNDFDCASGDVCDIDTLTCVSDAPIGSTTCHAPNDCDANETCSRSGTCTAGDCHFASVGCVRGYECSPQTGTWECLKATDVSGAGGAANGGEPGAPQAGETSSSNGGAASPDSAAGAGG